VAELNLTGDVFSPGLILIFVLFNSGIILFAGKIGSGFPRF